MRKSNIKLKAVSFDIRSFLNIVKNYSSIIMLLTLFTCGLITGVLTVKNSEYCRYLIGVFQSDDIEVSRMFINSIFLVISVMTLNFVMGLCLVGSPFIVLLSVSEGIVIGSLYAYRLYLCGYESFGRFFVSDLMFYVFLYVIFICSQYTSMVMSDSLKQYYCNRKGTFNLRGYLIKNFLFSSFAVLLVAIQSVIKLI